MTKTKKSQDKGSNRSSNFDALIKTQSSAQNAPATTGAVVGIAVLAVALAFLFLAWGRRKNENSRRSSRRPPSTRSGGGASNNSRRRTKSDSDRRIDKRSSSNRSDRLDDTDQTEESAEVEECLKICTEWCALSTIPSTVGVFLRHSFSRETCVKVNCDTVRIDEPTIAEVSSHQPTVNAWE